MLILTCCWLRFVQLTIVTTDKRKMQLVFKAHVIEMGENILVDFRLSRVSGNWFLNKKSLLFCSFIFHDFKTFLITANTGIKSFCWLL